MRNFKRLLLLTIVLVIIPLCAFAATLFTSGKFRAFDSTGAPLVGGSLYAYQAGTTTPQDTYVDQGGQTVNTNPVVLDENGEANVWLNGLYKFILTDANGNLQWVVDNISDSNVSTAFSGSSSTSSAVTTGTITFTVPAGKAWSAGQDLKISSNADAANFMLGTVTSYIGTTLVMNITSDGGSGTHTDWNISLSGGIGPTGATGPVGSGAGDVIGPATSTDGYIAIFDGTNNKTIKASTGGPGTAAFLNVGTGANQIVQLDGSAKLPALDGSALINVGGGDFKFITSHTATSSSSLDFTDLSSGCAAYVYILSDIRPSVNGANLYLRTSIDNGTSYAASNGNYIWAKHKITGMTAATPTDTLSGGGTGTSSTGFHVANSVANTSGYSVYGSVTVYDPSAGSNDDYISADIHQGALDPSEETTYGSRRSGTDTNAIRFIFSSGNITSGTIYEYCQSAS